MKTIIKKKAASQEEAKKMIHDTRGKIFGVSFTKKDGSHRDMTARLGVTKHLKGDEGKGRIYNPSDYNMLCVFDVKKEGYRTIPFDRLLELRFNKETYEITQE